MTEGFLSPHRRNWGLLVSLGVNILLIGIILGHVLHRPPRFGPEMLIAETTRSMSEADAAIVMEAINRADFTGVHQQIEMDIGRLRNLLIAPTFDAAAFDTALEGMMSRRRDFEASLKQSLIPAIARLSPAGRVELAKALHP